MRQEGLATQPVHESDTDGGSMAHESSSSDAEGAVGSNVGVRPPTTAQQAVAGTPVATGDNRSDAASGRHPRSAVGAQLGSHSRTGGHGVERAGDQGVLGTPPSVPSRVIEREVASGAPLVADKP